MKRTVLSFFIITITTAVAFAQQVETAATTISPRSTCRLDKGWKFAFGSAADPKKDFGCGTEYFNYLTKASSIHNEGPYAQLFNDSAWTEVQIPHDWVTTLPYAPEASHSHGYKTVGWNDITPYVNYGGENLVCVRADATLEEGWFYEGAGIYRDVWLEKTGEVSVAPFGTFVYSELQQPYNEAVVYVKTEVTNSTLKTQLYEVEQRILDAEGREVAHLQR